jgi:hypothetical protein
MTCLSDHANCSPKQPVTNPAVFITPKKIMIMKKILSFFKKFSPIKGYALLMIVVGLIMLFFIGKLRANRAGKGYVYHMEFLFKTLDLILRPMAFFLLAVGTFLLINQGLIDWDAWDEEE